MGCRHGVAHDGGEEATGMGGRTATPLGGKSDEASDHRDLDISCRLGAMARGPPVRADTSPARWAGFGSRGALVARGGARCEKRFDKTRPGRSQGRRQAELEKDESVGQGGRSYRRRKGPGSLRAIADSRGTRGALPTRRLDMIKKAGNKYVVLAESGRRMGSYDTKAEAQKRLRQVEFFKHAKTGGGSRRRSA